MIGNRKIVALLMPRAFEKTNYEMIEGINSRLVEHGDRLFIYHSCSDFLHGDMEEEGEGKIFEMIPYDVIDAAIIYEEYINDKSMVAKAVANLKNHNIPVAIIGKPYEGCMQFEFDYEAGFEKVVRHMVEYHGYKDVFFLSGLPDNDYSQVREDIVEKVLKEQGVCFDRANNLDYGYYWSTPARDAVTRMRKRSKLPRAIICANDSMAAAVCDELTSSGVKIPEEVAISGFDGIDDIYYSIPQVTSCVCDYDILAEKVCSSIYDYLADPKGEYVGSIKVPAELLVLSSCGCNKEIKMSAVEQVGELNFRIEKNLDTSMKFFVMTSRMMAADSINDLRTPMYIDYMKNVSCFVNPKVLDNSAFELELEERGIRKAEEEIPDTFKLLYYSNYDNYDYTCDVKLSDIHPDIMALLERPMPIVFNAVHISDKLLGMLMFHSDWLNIENMCIIPQVVIAMRTAISGYTMFGNQKYLSEQLINMYKRDELTGFLLRKSLDAEYHRIMKDLKKRGKRLGIMMADLDGLKVINDNFGHAEGDQAILTVARAVHSALPTSAVCFRYGGDEMLAVFEVKKDISIIYDDISFYLKRYNENAGKEYLTDVSVGISVDNEPGTRTMEDMIKEADDIMYSRKVNKKNHR